MHTLTEDGNQVYTLDYRPDGASFATAGQDTAVRVYDEATLTLTTTLRAESLGRPGSAVGHSSRVFSLKFVPEEAPLLLSGGWDNTVHLWDLRVGASVASIYGPHVCGDSVDVRGCEVLTGSYKPFKQLQLWDLRTRELISTVPYRQALGDLASGSVAPAAPAAASNCKVYSACFAKAGDGPSLIAAAGSGNAEGSGEVRVFSREGLKPLSRYVQPKAIYSVDTSYAGRRVAVTGGDDQVKMLEIPPAPPAAAVELA